jgi:hypothetical protein
MASFGAARVARLKERHPEQYCPEPRCLWHTGGGPCPRHAPAAPPLPKPSVKHVYVNFWGGAETRYPDDVAAEEARALEAEAAEEWRAEEEANEIADKDRAERGERDQDWRVA